MRKARMDGDGRGRAAPSQSRRSPTTTTMTMTTIAARTCEPDSGMRHRGEATAAPMSTAAGPMSGRAAKRRVAYAPRPAGDSIGEISSHGIGDCRRGSSAMPHLLNVSAATACRSRLRGRSAAAQCPSVVARGGACRGEFTYTMVHHLGQEVSLPVPRTYPPDRVPALHPCRTSVRNLAVSRGKDSGRASWKLASARPHFLGPKLQRDD